MAGVSSSGALLFTTSAFAEPGRFAGCSRLGQLGDQLAHVAERDPGAESMDKATRIHPHVTIMIVSHGRSRVQAGIPAIAHHVVIA